ELENARVDSRWITPAGARQPRGVEKVASGNLTFGRPAGIGQHVLKLVSVVPGVVLCTPGNVGPVLPTTARFPSWVNRSSSVKSTVRLLNSQLRKFDRPVEIALNDIVGNLLATANSASRPSSLKNIARCGRHGAPTHPQDLTISLF